MASAVIFDMDGVLVNSEPYHFEIEKLLLAGMGIKITSEEIHSFVGLAMDKMWERLKARYSLEKPVDLLVREDTAFRVDYFRKTGAIPPIEGVAELLQGIGRERLKTAVASSSHPDLIRTLLEATGLGIFFPVTVSGFDVGKGKPEPDIFIKTASLLGVAPSGCVVIEDSYNGVTAARRAGMICIGYRNPFSGSQDLSAAEMIIESFSEITPRMLKNL